jgi:uncharacterized protein YndB with AHSA1/START domain
MKTEPFILERTYNAPVKTVWEALTQKEKMKHWYFDLDEFKPEVGFEFSFSGQGSKGENYLHLCKITEVVKERKLAYSWQYKDHPGSSMLTFELFDENGQTRVKLTHEGLGTFPQDSPDFARESFAQGWTHILGISLKEFVEKDS